jgi:hypothetical protein
MPVLLAHLIGHLATVPSSQITDVVATITENSRTSTEYFQMIKGALGPSQDPCSQDPIPHLEPFPDIWRIPMPQAEID